MILLALAIAAAVTISTAAGFAATTTAWTIAAACLLFAAGLAIDRRDRKAD